MKIKLRDGICNNVHVLTDSGEDITQELNIKEININLTAGMVAEATIRCFIEVIDFDKIEIDKYELIDIEKNKVKIFTKRKN